jgi:hypothetical protein
MLASFPASMVNQKPSDLGIQNRFKLNPSRFSKHLGGGQHRRHVMVGFCYDLAEVGDRRVAWLRSQGYAK